MNKMVKKGFSMIELLFVMVILAALAAIAIPSMSSGTESATLTSMKSDMKNIMALIQSKYVDHQDYGYVLNGGVDNTTQDASTGYAVNPIAAADGTQTNIPLSAGNVLTIHSNAAASGTCTAAGQGYSITITNSNVPGKTVSYDSCTDGKIKVTTAG